MKGAFIVYKTLNQQIAVEMIFNFQEHIQLPLTVMNPVTTAVASFEESRAPNRPIFSEHLTYWAIGHQFLSTFNINCFHWWDLGPESAWFVID